jgi:hypothetical protein
MNLDDILSKIGELRHFCDEQKSAATKTIDNMERIDELLNDIAIHIQEGGVA